MRSTFVIVFIELILTAYLTCTNAGPVASGPAGHDFSNSNFNAPVLFGNENRVTSKTIIGAPDTEDSNPATTDPTCEIEDGHKICTCGTGFSYQSAPKPQCTPASKTLPSDLFCYVDKNKCYKFIEEKMIWDDAVTKCQDETLFFLAEPEPGFTETLRNYLRETYEKKIVKDIWLGAKGDKTTSQKWERTKPTIVADPSSEFWHAIDGIGVDTNCLILVTDEDHVNNKPGQPLYNAKCLLPKHVLCESEMV